MAETARDPEASPSSCSAVRVTEPSGPRSANRAVPAAPCVFTLPRSVAPVDPTASAAGALAAGASGSVVSVVGSLVTAPSGVVASSLAA